jgi:hypothetical protein
MPLVQEGAMRAAPQSRPTVNQHLKLLSYRHVQLHYTLIGLTLAAILGSDREATIFLCV